MTEIIEPKKEKIDVSKVKFLKVITETPKQEKVYNIVEYSVDKVKLNGNKLCVLIPPNSKVNIDRKAGFELATNGDL